MLQLDAIDRTADSPPYRQIARMLRAAILDGRLGPGERLPSEQELINHFGVARMTVRQAVHELRGEGLVVAEHGRGVFVRPRPPVRRLASDRFAREHRAAGKGAYLAEADKADYVPGVDRIEVTREWAPEGIAERLRLAPGAQVVVRFRRYLADGRPVQVATSYIPVEFAEGTKIVEMDTGPGGIYARLEDTGHVLNRYREEVTTRMPTPDERRTLELSEGTPVLNVVRTAYDVGDVAVEVCHSVKVGPAYELVYEFPAH